MANTIDITKLGNNADDAEKEELHAKNALLEAQVQELRKRSADFDIFNSTIQAGASKHIFDDKLTCYWANDYFYFMTGYSREEFSEKLDSSPIHIIRGEDSKKFITELQYCVDYGIQNFQMDLHITHREGHELCFKTAVSIVTDAETGLVHFYCIHTDITTAVRNQTIANRQTRFLETICNSMLMGICQHAVNKDGSLTFTYANSTAFSIWGCNREEYRRLFESDVVNMTHPEDKDFVQDTLFIVIREKSSAAFEHRIITKNGITKWLYVNLRYALNQDGQEAILCEFKDITEKRALRTENKSILENMPGFMSKYLIKDYPVLLEANDRYYEFFGTKLEDYKNANSAIVKSYHSEIYTRISENLDLLREGKPVSFSYRTIKADGSMAWLQLQSSCIDYQDGYPIYLAVQFDITNVKNLEFKLIEEKERYRIAYQNSAYMLFEYDIENDVLLFWKRNADDTDECVSFPEYFAKNSLESDTYLDDVPLIKGFLLGNTEKKIEIRRNMSKNGRSGYEWVETTGTTIYNDENKPIKVIGTFHGISEQDNSIYGKIESLIRSSPEKSYAIVRMDIDNFKMINDLYGWSEGDKILSYIANIIKDVVADESCPVGRVTADIFCICVPYEDKAKLLRLLGEVRVRIKKYPIDFNVVAHFGIYISEPGHDTPASVMFDRANLALKTIKEKVYTPFAFFDDNLRNTLLAEKRIERDMQAALDNGEFTAFYQPKYDISMGKIVGAEALVRWNQPGNGIVPPNMFIPLFERNGFILNLDEYIWECVCKKIHEWSEKGYKIIPISVNISRLHIFDPNFCTKLKNIVNKYNIPHNMLVLEFTESVFLDNVNELCRIMSDLRSEGFLLSMDDFGSGFSSLNMLKTIPLNEVKIDKEFLSETVTSAKGKTVVASTILMVNQLEMKIIAEGVETAEQAEFLLAAGCDTAQGFYYSKPVPCENFEQLAFKA